MRVRLWPVLWLFVASSASAQTDFYNPDRGRPLLIEDATTIEYQSFEFQMAPLRLERENGGKYSWGLEPELAWGVRRRTQLEFGVPLAIIDKAGRPVQRGVAGLDVELMHNLNVETLTLPALTLGVSSLLPVGDLGPRVAYGRLKGIATRTLGLAGRLHVNVEATAGPRAERLGGATGGTTAGPSGLELARWMAGAAFDRAIPARSVLLMAETYARRPLDPSRPLEWTAGAGLRWQVGPQLVFDAAAGRRVTGTEQAWYLTVGTAYAFGIARFVPLARP
ncbi:MAG: hypothetical protein ACK53A_12055 [Gemmatimonadota bacterium]|jgi:hypothetical protein|nr:hypothetical protein [Gemmatimonadota bacterium]